MKVGKPRGPTPSLIGGANGRPERVPVGRKSACSRCGTALLKGQTCIAIPHLRSPFSASKRVCEECFRKIVEKTREDLDAVSAI